MNALIYAFIQKPLTDFCSLVIVAKGEQISSFVVSETKSKKSDEKGRFRNKYMSEL